MSFAGLRVRGLSKRFGDVQAVEDLSFDVASGEIVGLLGPNGAGKTTTLQALAGMIHPSGGEAQLAGMPLEEARARVGFVPEQPEVFPQLTVEAHLGFIARADRLGAGWEDRAADILAALQLSDVREGAGGALSKGMKQKLLIACALLHEPAYSSWTSRWPGWIRSGSAN